MREERVKTQTAIAGIAGRQHGVITLTQLYNAGVSKSGVDRCLCSSHLHRIHRGVYAVGHRGLSNEGWWMAAVLACGEGAALSHRSAAEHWELLPPTRGIVHVTVPVPGGRSKRRGIHLHRSPSLPDAATTHKRIAVTTPGRTIADLKRSLPAELVRKAIREAEFRNMDLGATSTDGTRSELERRLLRLCSRYRLPRPEVNVPLGRFTVDFLWRAERLVVETDGYGAHRGRQAFEDDHQRDLELGLLGYRVLRFTDHQIRGRSARVAAAVRAALANRRP